MALPVDRASYIATCLRRCGSPVIQINVDPTQLDDIVDYCLKYYYDYHFDGSEKMYYKYQLTVTDISNQYITMPTNVIGVVSIFDLGGISAIASGSSLFSIPYQYAMDTLVGFNSSNMEMLPYVMTRTNLEMVEQILVGKQPIRYNRHINRLNLDMDWTRVVAGQWVVVECYQIIDPTVYIDAWSDRWLIRYGCAQIMQQWGINLTKFNGMQLPGGVQFNGEKILNDAREEIKKLEDEMINSFSLPATMMVG